MSLSCGARALKFSLFVFNLLCGIVCVCLGIWLIFDKYAVNNLASATSKVKGYEKDDGLRDLASKPTAVRQIGYLLLIGGILVIFVSSMGCVGAFKEWRPLLCCYATCLMLILSVEIAAAIYAAMHSHILSTDFRQILHSTLKLYNGTEAKSASDNGTALDFVMKRTWDNIMIDKKCCGVDSKVDDFKNSGWYTFNQGKYQFPPACCPLRANGKLMTYCPTIIRHGDGCYQKLKESLNEVSSNFKVVMWTAGFISLIQVFGIIVGFCLCDSIQGDEIY